MPTTSLNISFLRSSVPPRKVHFLRPGLDVFLLFSHIQYFINFFHSTFINFRPSIAFVLLLKSHLQSYPCPLQINFFWNLGFLLTVAILFQILTGIFLALHYTADVKSAYSSVFFLIREVYYGWSLRYLHASGASFVFFFLFIHLGRGLFYGSYFYNPNTWFSGIILLFLLMAIAFMGYVLPFGQMSFWGATVITNLLSPIPSLVEWVCGGYCVDNPTLKRFFIFHFILPFLLCGFLFLHFFYLHFQSSNNPLRLNTNNKIPFFPFLLIQRLTPSPAGNKFSIVRL